MAANPRFVGNLRFLAASLAAHGDLQEARAVGQPTGASGAASAAPEALPFEYMLNALRLVDGFSLAEYEQRTGLTRDTVLPELAAAASRGLMLSSADHNWRPSPLGRRFLNDLQALFLA